MTKQLLLSRPFAAAAAIAARSERLVLSPRRPVDTARPTARPIKQSVLIADDGCAVLSRDQLGLGGGVLTELELAILTMMAEGRRRSEMAQTLNMTVRTFQNVRKGLLAKLGARTESHAAAIGFRRGVLPLDRRTTSASDYPGAGRHS
jgi:DNA-binding CsgD family transcriptional regulator